MSGLDRRRVFPSWARIAACIVLLCQGLRSDATPNCPTIKGTVSGGGNVCAGNASSVSVDVVGSSGSGPFTVTLTNGGGTQSGPGPVLIFSVSPATTTTYQLASGADTNGCPIDGLGSATVTVYPVPTATVSGSTQICAGGQATIQAELTGAGQWNVGWSDGLQQNGVTTSLVSRVVAPAATSTYSVISLSDARCIEGTGSGAATVTIVSQPIAAIAAPSSICAGSSANSASTPDAGPSALYTWTVSNGTIVSGGGTRQIRFAPAGSSPVVLDLLVTVGAGCLATDRRTVPVDPAPVTPTIAAPARVSAGQSGLTASVAAHAGSTYSWSITNGTIESGSGTNQVIFTAGSGGTVSLSVVETNAQGCASLAATLPIVVDSGTQVLAAVISTPGQFGSFFKTSEQIHNPYAFPISGKFVFHAQGVPGSDSDPSVSYSLNPGQTLSFPDLLAAFAPTASSHAAIQALSGVGSADLVVASGSLTPVSLTRIYNDGGARGTTGMTEEALGSERTLKGGDRGVILAPPDPGNARLNIGIRTLKSDGSIKFIVKSKDGIVLATTTRDYPQSFFEQASAVDLFGIDFTGNESITASVLSGDAIVYGAVADNTTQDPSLQLASRVPASLPEGSIRILPVVVSTPGSLGSNFKTGVQLHNPGTSAISGRLIYRQGLSSTDGQAFLPYSLAAGQTLFIADLLPAMGQTGLASIDVVATTGAPPVTVARVFNDAGTAGTTGFTQELVDPADALKPGDRGVLIAPPDTTLYRWNLGARALSSGATLTLTVRNAMGDVVATTTKTYPANALEQREASAYLGAPVTASETVTVEVTSGSAIVYAASADNITQDPSVQTAKRLPQ
jgi:hypothetical protein